MTRNRIELRAPSHTGRVAELIAITFAECVYPINVEVVNCMPHDITLSEVKGLYLRGVTVFDGSNKKVVQIESEAQFIRLASSVQQIAVLNGHEYAVMTIETIAGDEQSRDPEPKPEPEVDLNQKPEITDQGGDESGNGTGDDSGNDDGKTDYSEENPGANADDNKEGNEPPLIGEQTPPQENDEATETDAPKKVSSKKPGKSYANSSKSGD
ncbi:hypothetical protein [Nitrosomonas ureae]|uniref:Uncharacterized protein n=1 Tax=Nitrosomonas ureae TaxID=44577 RepID=A0A2T5ISR7_9PROT|nr:hypothetical protein [Nitrosomonas ureae]PTQ86866.1 hypothetical protein C8R28_100861 [Nitrosomonas ureae]